MLCLSNEVIPIVQSIVHIEIYDWSCIFNHVIEWHFGTSWVVTFNAALTLQSQRLIFRVACATHYACLADSRSVLRQCHCCCCCCSVFVILIFTIFLSNFIWFFKQFYFRFFCISNFDKVVCSSILLLLCVCSLLFYKHIVHWYAYESCFVGSSIYYQLSLGVD